MGLGSLLFNQDAALISQALTGQVSKGLDELQLDSTDGLSETGRTLLTQLNKVFGKYQAKIEELQAAQLKREENVRRFMDEQAKMSEQHNQHGIFGHGTAQANGRTNHTPHHGAGEGQTLPLAFTRKTARQH